MKTFLEKPLTQLAIQKQVILTNNPAIKELLLKSSNKVIVLNNKNFYSSHYNPFHYRSHDKYNMHIWLSSEIARIAVSIIYHN